MILTKQQSKVWYKEPWPWLLMAGPAIVVVAGFFTLYLAISRPDPVYTDAQRAVVAQPSTPAAATLTPAMQARNHAATGGVARAQRP